MTQQRIPDGTLHLTPSRVKILVAALAVLRSWLGTSMADEAWMHAQPMTYQDFWWRAETLEVLMQPVAKNSAGMDLAVELGDRSVLTAALGMYVQSVQGHGQHDDLRRLVGYVTGYRDVPRK